MELTIIRHAQSTNNALPSPKNRVCDPPLTELGHRQAGILAQHLATGQRLAPWQADPFEHGGYSFTRLYCSPMYRSLQTAQPIARALELTPEVWVDIHERGGIYLDHGEAGGIVGYPGRTRREILSEFPGYTLSEGITEQGWWRYRGREDRQTFYGRAVQVALTLREQAASDDRIALVTHGDFIDGLLKALFNQLPGTGIAYRHLNAAVTSIRLHGDGKLTVAYLNRAEYLPPDLLS
jgi:2,3-bisphosphoglycerate-dependent phosphoglycerate mutase